MSLINITSLKKEVIDKIEYWMPPVSELQPLRKEPSSSLKIAVIVDNRLYQGLRYEAKLVILTPNNWEKELINNRIDFLLVESCLQTITGHWNLGQSLNKEHNESLVSIINAAKTWSIPTVFWNTQDHLYHTHYLDFSKLFDFVFCCDHKEQELLTRDGVKSEILLPAVQPAIHNGFQQNDQENGDFSIDVLFDGFTDLYRLEEELEVLQNIIPYGLKIIDSQAEIYSTKTKDLPLYEEVFLGSVTHDTRLSTLKFTKTIVTFGESLRSETLQRWLTLEAIACRVPIIFRGTLEPNDIRNGLVSCCQTDRELLLKLESFYQDDLYRKRLAHLAWRTVFQQHTFSDRLSKICNVVGINYDYTKFPIASVVAPTFRPRNMAKIIDTFNKQTYPNKELIIAINHNKPELFQVPSADELSDKIHIVTVPQDYFAGGAMNFGNATATGEICLRMDDDDIYGDNYLLDVMLHLKSVDATIFGSPAKYMHFKGSNSLLVSAGDKNFLSIVSPKYYGKKGAWITGNTLGGKHSIFSALPYKNHAFGVADAAFTLNVKNDIPYFILLDEFNMVITRGTNEKDHTWRITSNKLKEEFSTNSILEINDAIL